MVSCYMENMLILVICRRLSCLYEFEYFEGLFDETCLH